LFPEATVNTCPGDIISNARRNPELRYPPERKYVEPILFAKGYDDMEDVIYLSCQGDIILGLEI
jgi:hypothetical protein